jgi:hypothetical protein
LQAKRQPTQAPRPTIATVEAAVITPLKSIVAIAVAISSMTFQPFLLYLPAYAPIDDSSHQSESKNRPEDLYPKRHPSDTHCFRVSIQGIY